MTTSFETLITQLEKLDAEATKGPRYTTLVITPMLDASISILPDKGEIIAAPRHEAYAQALAQSRNALPALLKMLRVMHDELERLSECQTSHWVDRMDAEETLEEVERLAQEAGCFKEGVKGDE